MPGKNQQGGTSPSHDVLHSSYDCIFFFFLWGGGLGLFVKKALFLAPFSLPVDPSGTAFNYSELFWFSDSGYQF
jgi:hypothetical protein